MVRIMIMKKPMARRAWRGNPSRKENKRIQKRDLVAVVVNNVVRKNIL